MLTEHNANRETNVSEGNRAEEAQLIELLMQLSPEDRAEWLDFSRAFHLYRGRERGEARLLGRSG